ncbi:HAD family phosphatase [Myxococcota bacterium]|nr:HAD family phosphatase [Myxococcota bacterium]
MKPEAAIFDFDGTLVDTMPLHYEAYRQVFAELSIELTPDDFYGNVGGKAKETIPRFLRGRPCAVGVEELHARKKARLEVILDDVEIPVLETAKLVPVFASMTKVALASSGSRPGIEKILARLGWSSWFGAIVTGEDAPRGKPAPDLFVLAASRLGVDPRHCIAFEDTDDGCASARAAGMTVFDVRRAIAPTSLRGLAR